ncbi:NAD-dependent epimerase/dehydratase family protein [Marinobacter sp. 1_MG-2023]|uniref:NAD-dependent epimerase/dehydratase family protein n=1 Tax=Marinobacter sp. 1_MG-2023 TaxID=3062627 RepID=UPI0026E2B2D4|nr:NAD-dependent epimerase/dehydratase family protein [Marinobacter sp. 1_MG-2023]MDO6823308.1 NAD-dependent epimerase/dehydratase family protein [Marinobacter sp. 1_MG-2023]
MKVLLTGAFGFIGHRILTSLANREKAVVGVGRSRSMNIASDFIATKYVDVVDGATDWSGYFEGITSVVHCAAVAHGKRGDVWAVNVEGAENLARQAAKAGIQRFVFLSSIGVNGSSSLLPFTEEAHPNPTDVYARSKWEAEQRLWTVQKETGIELVIIRPPLVYGPGAPGNFGALLRWVAKGAPIPLGAIHNKRSLVALDNLVDLVITCIDHPAAANQVFLVSDGVDLSTTELLRGMGKAMRKPAWLIPVPAGLLLAGATILGKKAMAQRVMDSLQVNSSKAQCLLGWQPPLSVEEGLKRCFPDN